MRFIVVGVGVVMLAACSHEKSAAPAGDMPTQMRPHDLFGADLTGADLLAVPADDLAMPTDEDMTGMSPKDMSTSSPPKDMVKADLTKPPPPDFSGYDLLPPPSPTIAGCAILPPNHVFNTPIDHLFTHPNSMQFMTTIGDVNIHLDLGKSVTMNAADYYGIPYNVVHGNSGAWTPALYQSAKSLGYSAPRDECDCSITAAHTLVSPCTAAAAAAPLFPIFAGPLVEGGTVADTSGAAYGDHHILLLDADTCRLWELYHAYTGSGGTWDIFGSATWDLHSNTLRPKDWTSADAAGFPILPLLLRADEASSGVIKHALRFTIDSSSIRNEYVWPARHLTNNGTSSTDLPPMGQLFRIKSSYTIPSGYSTQSKAILQALKTYGMYLADGGTNLYIQGEPSASWSDKIFDEVQQVGSDQFEAVDISDIMARPGWSEASGAAPAP